MALNRGYRVLVTDGRRYLWRVRHRHAEGCDEILAIRRVASPSGRALHFRPKPGFVIPEGGTWPAGVVADDAGRTLNLNEPGVVRAFVGALTAAEWDAAEWDAAEWDAADRSYRHLDGWLWFEAAHREWAPR